MISIILATDSDNLIGIEIQNKEGNTEYYMPWKLDNKEDLKYFKEVTTGHNVIMGYNTWINIGAKPLSNRVNIVITKSHYDELKPFETDCFKVFQSDESALNSVRPQEETFIIGGKTLFDKYWDVANYIYHTRIKAYHSYIDEDDSKIIRRIYAQSINENHYDLVNLQARGNYVWEKWKHKK